MKLTRLLSYFRRVASPRPEDTVIQFVLRGDILTVFNVSFDVGENVWTVNLTSQVDRP